MEYLLIYIYVFKEIKAINKSLTDRNKELEAANLRQRSTINKLLDEKKENELTISTLKEEIKKIKSCKPLDHSKWREWNTDELYNFFINMFDDDRLKKYLDPIKEELFGGEYIGENIPKIKEQHLKQDFGIKNFGIRTDVWDKIQKLINNNNINNNQNDFEGANAPTAYI